MSRRVNLPGASELFRRTETDAVDLVPVPASRSTATPSRASSPALAEPADAAHTGRVRHDEKMTVYVSSGELVALDQSKLSLRAEHGLKVDRGRIVRAAVAAALADFAERGADSDLVQQLRED